MEECNGTLLIAEILDYLVLTGSTLYLHWRHRDRGRLHSNIVGTECDASLGDCGTFHDAV